jgi:serine/threonine protein kinase/WD40 repeat protein
MPDPTDPPAGADRNLLFGVLALQMDFVTRDALLRGMNAWALEKGKPLAQVLQDQGGLAADARALLEPLVEKHLAVHGGDPRRSLAAVGAVGSVKDDLRHVPDPDVQASLAHLPATPPDDPYATKYQTDPAATTGGDPNPAAGPTPSTPAAGRFRVLRAHARGGLGQVSVALDRELNREVALKEIHGRHADDPGSRARFLLEAEVTGRLEHPGIVPVYSLGHFPDGRPFYAMRFIRGDSLKEAVERFHRADVAGRDEGERGLALRGLLGRFVDVCNAVAYAHDRGVLHRDLKPGNIMLGPYGETLVVDWGLAKPLGQRTGDTATEEPTLRPGPAGGSSATAAGSAVGTPQYMPPEQAAGRLDELGPASDVYSLGATLYCLLTGKPPFDGPAAGAVIAAVQKGEFPRPRQVNPRVPPALEAVCLRAMALRPADRYGSARELADEVERWLADEPVRAWPEPWTARLSRWTRRNRAALSLVALVLMTALASSALFFWYVALQDNAELVTQRNDLNHEITTAREEKDQLGEEMGRLTAELRQIEGQKVELEQAVRAQSQVEDRLAKEIARQKQEARAGLVRQIGQLYSLRELGAAREHLGRFEKEFPDSLDRFDIGYLRNVLVPVSRTLQGHTADIQAVHVAEDGRTVRTAAEDGTIRTWDLQTGETRSVVPFLPGMIGVAFSADKDGSIVITQVGDGSPARRAGIEPGDRLVSVVGADAEAVPVAGRPLDKVIELVTGPPDTAVKLNLTRPPSPDIRAVEVRRGPPLPARWGHHRQFSPDGRWLAYTDERGSAVNLVETATGRLHRQAFRLPAGQEGSGGNPPRVCALAISPDSSRIAVGFNSDARVFVGDLRTRGWVNSFRGAGGVVAGACWSADGAWLFTGNAGDVGLGAWDVATGRRAWQPVPNIASAGEMMAASPDGNWLVYGGGITTSAYVVRTGPAHPDVPTEVQTLPRVRRTYPVYATSPSGVLVAAATGSHIYLCHARRGKLLRLFDAGRGDVDCLAFAADSRKLLAGIGPRLVVFDLDIEPEYRPLSFGVEDYATATCFDPARGHVLVARGGTRPGGDADPVPAQVAAYDPATGSPAGRPFGPEWPRRSNALALSPDGGRLAVIQTPADRDELEETTVEIWDLAKRQVLSTARLPVPGGACTASFSPDGGALVVARWQVLSTDDMQSPDSLRRFREYPAYLLDGRTAEVRARLVHPKSCYIGHFTPDGKRLVTLSGGEVGDRVTVWDLGRLVPEYHFAVRANAIAVSPDGGWLVTAYHGPGHSLFGRSPVFGVYDLETGEEFASWEEKDMLGRVDAGLHFSPDGELLAAGTVQGHLRVWDWATLETVAAAQVPGGEQGQGVFGMAFRPDSASVLFSGDRFSRPGAGVVRRWDFRAGRFETVKEGLVVPILSTPAADGRVAVLSPVTNAVSVLDLPAGTGFDLPRAEPKAATRGRITALAASSDGRYLAVVDDWQTVRLVDRAQGKVVHSWEKLLEVVDVLRFSPDGRTLYAAGRHGTDPKNGPTGMVVSWDVETRAELARWPTCPLGTLATNPASRYMSFVDLAADGRLAAFTSNVYGGQRPTVQVWDVTTGERLATISADDGDRKAWRSFRGVRLDPTGKRLVGICSEGRPDPEAGEVWVYSVRIWDAETGRLDHRWTVTPNLVDRREESVLRADISPDGRLVAVGKMNGRVDLLDVATGQRVMTFDLDDEATVTQLQFSPDGKALVAGTTMTVTRLFTAR